MALPEITENIIRELATISSYLRGIEYFENGEVDRVWIENGKYNAYVQGAELYKVTISGKKGNIQATCSCPYDWEGICKHAVAVMLTVLNEKKAEEHGTNLQEITKLIEDTEPEKIKEFLLNILSNDEPALKDFRIFIVGEKETNATRDNYKREILELLETSGSREDYYDDDYYGDYDSPIDDIISVFTETAEKYNREANYILEKRNIALSPPIRFGLLVLSRDKVAAAEFGKSNYKEYPEIALPLSEIYLKDGLRDEAIQTAESAVQILKERTGDFHYEYSAFENLERLGVFLDKTYDHDKDYKKAVDNLLMLIHVSQEIKYYRKLRELLRMDKEKAEILKLLKVLLKGYPETLFRIYSIEDDHERMLSLAEKNLREDIFPQIVKRPRDRYPHECFDLYKKKINDFLKDTKDRKAYRKVANWLKQAKDIPDIDSRFKRYVNHIRTKHRRRPALMDEIKGL